MENKVLIPIVGIHSAGKSTILSILDKWGYITQGECAEEIRVNKKVKAGASGNSSFEELVKKAELERDKIRDWKSERVIFVESWHILTLAYMLTRGKKLEDISEYLEYVKNEQKRLKIVCFYLKSNPYNILERSRKLHTEEDIDKYYTFYEKLQLNIEYILKLLNVEYYEFNTTKPIEETKKEIQECLFKLNISKKELVKS